MRIGIYANVIAAVLTFPTPAQAIDPKVEDACMLKHEIAHACGWPAHHPDALVDATCQALMPTKSYNQCKPVEIKRAMPFDMARICNAPACTICFERGCVIYLPTRDTSFARTSIRSKR